MLRIWPVYHFPLILCCCVFCSRIPVGISFILTCFVCHSSVQHIMYHYVIWLQPYSFGHHSLEVWEKIKLALFPMRFDQFLLNISSLCGSVVSNISTESQDCLCWFMYSKVKGVDVGIPTEYHIWLVEILLYWRSNFKSWTIEQLFWEVFPWFFSVQQDKFCNSTLQVPPPPQCLVVIQLFGRHWCCYICQSTQN